jgi:leader peptidase (prepilin peptidase)/N-methyltransferase
MILSNEMRYALINGCYTGLYIVLVQLIAFFGRRIVNYQTQQTRSVALAHGILCASIALCLSFITTQYPSPYNYIYAAFACCITISIFTDAYALLISEIFTSYTIPLAWLAAYYGWLPITLNESMYASILAALILKATYLISRWAMRKEAMGSGDIDIFCFIAAWLGFYGAWFALTVGSCLGALYGIIRIVCGADKNNLKLPLGTFLGIGALLYLVWQ